MRSLGFLAILICLSFSYAQSWSVQTVALQNYQEALARQEQLYELGFDAYVDFGMTNGQQFARVRIGCFANRVAAQTYATLLKGRVTADAVPVPLEAGAKTTYCSERSVGFKPSEAWALYKEDAGAVSFWVDVLDKRAYVALNARGWHLAQDETELAKLLVPTATTGYHDIFSETAAFGTSAVILGWGAKDFILSSGQLLWQSAYSAVVLEADTVVAYHIRGGTP